MSLLLSAIWPALAAALLLGLVVGAWAGLPRERMGLSVAGSLALALAGLVGLAVAGAVPGEAGLWVESGALVLATYLAGCGLGGAGRLVLAGRA